jgi:hypothetical protein
MLKYLGMYSLVKSLGLIIVKAFPSGIQVRNSKASSSSSAMSWVVKVGLSLFSVLEDDGGASEHGGASVFVVVTLLVGETEGTRIDVVMGGGVDDRRAKLPRLEFSWSCNFAVASNSAVRIDDATSTRVIKGFNLRL